MNTEVQPLYHYTSSYHLPKILSSGRLTLTESNIGSPNPRLKPYGEHVGPDVVWLTDVQNLTRGHGLGSSGVNKFGIRFTILAPAIRWATFAAQHGMNKRWFRALDDGSAKHWWVCPYEIPSSNWVEIYDVERRTVLFTAAAPTVAA